MLWSQRFTDLEKVLESLYETLGQVERRLAITNDIFEKTSIRQRIREEVLPAIRESETEYWQLLNQEAATLVIQEPDANDAIVEILQTIDVIEQNSSTYSEQVVQLLVDIRNKLNEPEASSSAKLKAAVPLFPPFISYEAEIETEGFLKRFLPTFSRLLQKAQKK